MLGRENFLWVGVNFGIPKPNPLFPIKTLPRYYCGFDIGGGPNEDTGWCIIQNNIY